jgi:hypothetical protein
VIGRSIRGIAIIAHTDAQDQPALIAKAPKTAGRFEGDVDVIGGLTVRGVNIEGLFLRIQQLEQRVATLSMTGTGEMAFVNVGVQRPPGGLSFLHISGDGFKPGEEVQLKITEKLGTGNPFSQTQQTTASSSGGIDFKFGGSGGGVCGGGLTLKTFQVQGTGLTSSKMSNIATTGCQ